MSYNKKVLISSDSKEIFTAINQNVQQWWGNTDTPVSKVGHEFTTCFDKTYWKFRIIDLTPYRKIVWKCFEARHVHNGYNDIEKEWVGTFVHWTIESISSKESELSFSHDGLTPDLNCYEICTPAWDRFVTQSLKSFVETGVGMPHLS